LRLARGTALPGFPAVVLVLPGLGYGRGDRLRAGLGVAEEAGAVEVGGDVGRGGDQEAAQLVFLSGVEAALGDGDAHVAEDVALGVKQGGAEADRGLGALA